MIAENEKLYYIFLSYVKEAAVSKHFHSNGEWHESEGDEEEAWKKAHDERMAELERERGLRRAQSEADVRAEFWNEEKWENFLQRIDLDGRETIRFYENYWNHSDRDRFVEQAIALHAVQKAFACIYPTFEAMKRYRQYLRLELNNPEIAIVEDQAYLDAKENSLYQISAYRQARNLFCQINDWRQSLPVPTWYTPGGPAPLFESLIRDAALMYIKIAGGHVIGYQPHTLGGNIAETKRALRHSHQIREYLYQLRGCTGIEPRKYLPIADMAYETRNAIALRISELRDLWFAKIAGM